MNVSVIAELISGMDFLLQQFGQLISLRHPVDNSNQVNDQWYTDFRFYNQEQVVAFPYNSEERRIIEPYSYDMAGRVEGGMMEWVFRRGRRNATKNTRIGVNNRFYPVVEVRGDLYDGINPRIQHVVMGL